MINIINNCIALACTNFKFGQFLRMEDVGSVNNALDEEHIIFGVIFIIKDGQLAELYMWAPQCHIHVRDGSPRCHIHVRDGSPRCHIHVRDGSLEAGVGLKVWTRCLC